MTKILDIPRDAESPQEGVQGGVAPDARDQTSVGHAKDRGRTFLVVVDSTPECHNALRFAARRAARTGGGVAMLYVIPKDEAQIFVMVGQRMREEARAEAEQRLRALAREVREQVGVLPEIILREGLPEEEVLRLLDERDDIRVLVLGASDSHDGPGPLVSALAGRKAGRMPTPVTVVPGALSIADIDIVS